MLTSALSKVRNEQSFPVVSPLAALLSGARTRAEGDTFFSCSLLLALRNGEKALTETQADMKMD